MSNEPTPEQLRYFYIINFIDMAHSYYAISNHPHLREGNPLLPRKPSAAQFILHKGITVPLIGDNVEAGQMAILNAMITLTVLRNIYLYENTPKCPTNFYYYGGRIPCQL